MCCDETDKFIEDALGDAATPKPKKKKGRKGLSDDLPREPVYHNLSEEEKERANEELERIANYEDEEGGEEEDPEEKARQESRAKEEERVKAEMKKLKALYDETYLKRLLRLLDVLTSIAVVH